MIEITWLRSHVSQLLEREWDMCRVELDGDGDVPFLAGTAACWVSVVSADDVPYARVWGHAVHGIKKTSKLLAELHDINARSRTAKVYWSDNVIVVEQALHAHGVNQVTLAQARGAVGGLADDIGHLIASMYGGATPFPVDENQDENEEEAR